MPARAVLDPDIESHTGIPTRKPTMSDNTSQPLDDADGGPGFPRWLKWGLLGALAVLVVGYGVIFLYAKVLNDSPDELDSDDLAAALADEPVADDDPTATATTDAPAATDAPVTSKPATTEPDTNEPAVSDPATSSAPADADDPAAGSPWTATDASQLGYRVKEVLFGVDTDAVGRTNQVTGELTIEGTQVTTASFTVDVASIESDDGRRDGQFRGRIMSTDEFPEATFVLTEPIELGTEPVEGASVTTSATGDLTLRGVTNTVTFDVEAQLQGGRIGVLGSIPVVFADYEIDNPSFGGVQTEDEGLLEFVLVFEQ